MQSFALTNYPIPTVSDHTTPLRQDEPLLKFAEVLDYLKCSRSTLNRLIKSKQLTGYKVGWTYRFFLSDVQKCLQVA